MIFCSTRLSAIVTIVENAVDISVQYLPKSILKYKDFINVFAFSSV
nr:MAG TPA: hypothetical protein [Caudoviricetes sp.]